MSKLKNLFWLALLCAGSALAGGQKYEPLSASVQAAMSKAISDQAVETRLTEKPVVKTWLSEMSRRLAKRLPDQDYREDLLSTVYYEASRAGLDPEMVMGLIEVESGFRKYAVSTVGARGYMQVMPFWVQQIGVPDQDLFHLRINLRYGCTILRHYLDTEHGNLFRALGRYNGSLGQAEYPNMVLAAWKNHWDYDKSSTPGKQARAEN
jgi:soluble lytic murein transglycosylase-like protein